MIIWINGAFGAGKTSTAFELHRRLPNSFVYDPENVGYFIRKKAKVTSPLTPWKPMSSKGSSTLVLSLVRKRLMPSSSIGEQHRQKPMQPDLTPKWCPLINFINNK